MSNSEYQIVELSDIIFDCIGDSNGFHFWIHDSMIWSLPNEPQDPHPFMWVCRNCGKKIRTSRIIPGFHFDEE